MTVNFTNNDNNVYYARRSRNDAVEGFLLASMASGAVMRTLPYFSKPFINQLKQEHINNKEYVGSLLKGLSDSGLEKLGVTIKNTVFNKEDLIKVGTNLEPLIQDKEIKFGLNATYTPKIKRVKLNLDKASICGFHELGHAMNNLQGKFGNVLQKMRYPGYVLAGLMGTISLFPRKKAKGDKQNVWSFIQDNCAKIAFIGMLPTVAEEALASYKGIKLAKASGVESSALKNLKRLYGKALISYIGYAAVTSLSVYIASKITEHFTRPKRIEIPSQFY